MVVIVVVFLYVLISLTRYSEKVCEHVFFRIKICFVNFIDMLSRSRNDLPEADHGFWQRRCSE